MADGWKGRMHLVSSGAHLEPTLPYSLAKMVRVEKKLSEEQAIDSHDTKRPGYARNTISTAAREMPMPSNLNLRLSDAKTNVTSITSKSGEVPACVFK